MMWKQIPNFDNYEASEEGEIRNKKTGKILKPSIHSDGTGVPLVSLVNEHGTSILEVKFIVACTYLGVDFNSRPKPKIEYIDNNKFNNAVSNLRIKSSKSLEDEEWKPITDFEESYAISNKGRVKRLERNDIFVRKDTGKEVTRKIGELIIKLTENSSNGYYEINLREGNKSVYRTVHRMVAQAFIPNPDNLPQVNHKDGNKHNNEVSNLEWCTCSDNVKHAIESKLRPSGKGSNRTQKEVLCIETGQRFKNAKEACEVMNLSYSSLMEHIHENKQYKGYTFKQVDKDIRVKCLDTGEVFQTAAAAAEHFNLSDITSSIKSRTCIDGWTFCYMRDAIQDEAAYLWECRNRYAKWPRANKRWEDK